MHVLGLTGGIASGKSTVAAQFRTLGVPVFDADRSVHRLLEDDAELMERIATQFPECLQTQRIDREALAQQVFASDHAMQRLEALLHPRVFAEETCFIRRTRKQRRPLVVLDIPLLFEAARTHRYDSIAVTFAPMRVRRARALQRPHMTPARLQRIMARQCPAHHRHAAVDYVIHTALGRAHSMRQVRAIVQAITQSSRKKHISDASL